MAVAKKSPKLHFIIGLILLMTVYYCYGSNVGGSVRHAFSTRLGQRLFNTDFVIFFSLQLAGVVARFIGSPRAVFWCGRLTIWAGVIAFLTPIAFLYLVKVIPS